MIHISTKNSVVTLINVFTVDPANQQRLIELLTCATEGSVRHAPALFRRVCIAVSTGPRSRCMPSG